MKPSRESLKILEEFAICIENGCPVVIGYSNVREKMIREKCIMELLNLGAIQGMTLHLPDGGNGFVSSTGSWAVSSGPKLGELLKKYIYKRAPLSVNYDKKNFKLEIKIFADYLEMLCQVNISGGKRRALCETLFRNRKNMQKTWSFDQILEDWEPYSGSIDLSSKVNLRKPYDSARAINLLVHANAPTEVPDLILIKNSTLQVNPKYLR